MIVLINFLVICTVLQSSVLGDKVQIKNAKACMEFCTTTGHAGNFNDGTCICEPATNEDDASSASRAQRQLENVNFGPTAKHFANEERSARCILGSRRRLRPHDAGRVAKYFLNGGPLTGNSHFIGTPSQTSIGAQEDECVQDENLSSPGNTDDIKDDLPDQEKSKLPAKNYIPILGAPYTQAYYIPDSMPILPTPYEQMINNAYKPVNPISHILSHSMDIMYPSPLAHLPRLYHPHSNIIPGIGQTLIALPKYVPHNSFRSHPLSNLLGRKANFYSSNRNGNINKSTNNDFSQNYPTDEQPEAKKCITKMVGQSRESENSESNPYNQGSQMPVYPIHQGFLPRFGDLPNHGYILHPVKVIPQTLQSTNQIASPQRFSNCLDNTAKASEDSTEDDDDNSTDMTREKEEFEQNSDGTGDDLGISIKDNK